MCCFSRPVQQVADTKIYARDSKDGKQFVVYSMLVSSKEDLAMILPIPTPKESKDDAVRFLNFQTYPKFFTDMANGFPEPKFNMPAFGGFAGGLGGGAAPPPPLKVVDVGSYEASFVPAVKDFARLDERFRLSSEVWDKLPMYKDWGFAVFKLKKGSRYIHPMGFEFPRANPKQLFFPTVHIHDGKVHPKAGYDHALYCQSESVKMMGWRESVRPAGMFLSSPRLGALIDPRKHVYYLSMVGELKNEDVTI